MRTTGLVNTAETIARREHAGQKDKAGEDYIGHPARVAGHVRSQGGTDEAIAVAWLHDVLEDCDVSPADLKTAGIPTTVIAAVESVTKIQGETTEEYCARVRGNALGLQVKAADLDDNTDPIRVASLPAGTRTRLAIKYQYVRSLLGLEKPS